jgi:hypothetical protein
MNPASLLELLQERAGSDEPAVLLSAAGAEGLTALLHRELDAGAGEDLFDGPQRERLREWAASVTARNLLLADELAAVLAALAAAGVTVCPLRGPDLSQRLHGDSTLRPSGDLDLLIHAEQMADVVAALGGLDYRSMDRRPGFARDFYYTAKFFRDRHGWVITEPHWSLAYPPFLGRLDMDPVWARTTPAEAFGAPVRRLSAADELLHLCLHRVHHGPAAPLLWDLELDRYVRMAGPGLDWDTLTDTARVSGQAFFLRRALEPVRARFSTPLPEGWLEGLPAEPEDSREGRLVRLLATAPDVDGRESLAVWFTLRGLRRRMRYLFALLVPTPTFMRLQYGLSRRRQLPLAYLGRWWYFARMALRGLLRLRRR